MEKLFKNIMLLCIMLLMIAGLSELQSIRSTNDIINSELMQIKYDIKSIGFLNYNQHNIEIEQLDAILVEIEKRY